MKAGRITQIASTEFKTIIRLPIYWILLAVIALFAFSYNPDGLVSTSRIANSGIKLITNSQHAVAQFFAFSGLIIYSLLGSVIAGLSVFRDT